MLNRIPYDLMDYIIDYDTYDPHSILPDLDYDFMEKRTRPLPRESYIKIRTMIDVLRGRNISPSAKENDNHPESVKDKYNKEWKEKFKEWDEKNKDLSAEEWFEKSPHWSGTPEYRSMRWEYFKELWGEQAYYYQESLKDLYNIIYGNGLNLMPDFTDDILDIILDAIL